MNIITTSHPVDLADISDLRRQHLDQLVAGQEALLEMLVPEAACFEIRAKDGGLCGYFLLHGGETIIEYHITPPYLAFCHIIFAALVVRHNVRTALVKSFDHVFLTGAMDVQIAVHSQGALVRDFVPRPLPTIPSIRYHQRTASEADLDRIRAVEQDVFTDPARLLAVVRRGNLRVFESDAGAVIGFGIMRTVIPGRPEVDVGIAIDRPFRAKGYAIYIMRDMLQHCLDSGFRPIVGCAMDNEPSKQMGLRVGLIAKYRLLEVTFR